MRGHFEIGADVKQIPEEMAVVDAVAEAFGQRATGVAVMTGPCPCGNPDHPKLLILVGFQWWHWPAFLRLNLKLRLAAKAAHVHATGITPYVDVRAMSRRLWKDGLAIAKLEQQGAL